MGGAGGGGGVELWEKMVWVVERTESEEGKSYIIEIEFQFCVLNYLFLKSLIF